MRRRNRPKVVWLPACNTNSVDGATTARSAIQFQFFQADSSTQGGVGSIEIPIVQDSPLQSGPLSPTSSLADIENSGYRLRRIVGEIYIDCVQDAVGGPATHHVSAGFIVRRVDPATGISLAATSTAAASSLDLDDIESNMDPWIWRRSWRMTHDVAAAAAPLSNVEFFQGPHDNYTRGNGSLYTGPHVDQKTARIVGPEERLFLDVSATTMLADGLVGGLTTFLIACDLRVLASMRTNIGNRRNASR